MWNRDFSRYVELNNKKKLKKDWAGKNTVTIGRCSKLTF